MTDARWTCHACAHTLEVPLSAFVSRCPACGAEYELVYVVHNWHPTHEVPFSRVFGAPISSARMNEPYTMATGRGPPLFLCYSQEARDYLEAQHLQKKGLFSRKARRNASPRIVLVPPDTRVGATRAALEMEILVSALKEHVRALTGENIQPVDALWPDTVGYRMHGPRVAGLGLPGCGLTTLPEVFTRLVDLVQVNLASNRFSEPPFPVAYWRRLRVLDLRANALTSTRRLWYLPAVEYLDLQHNLLTDITPAVGEADSLRYLDLSHNRLTGVPAVLGKLTNLATLNLAGNQVTVLPEELGALSQLKNLLLAGNPLPALPRTLDQLESLTEITLDPALAADPALVALRAVRGSALRVVLEPSDEDLAVSRAFPSDLPFPDPADDEEPPIELDFDGNEILD